jgi:glycosyltransferase involved in cell wall biosynthesis
MSGANLTDEPGTVGGAGLERPRRILFVDHATIAGGAQLVLAAHIRALDRRRFEPFIACTNALPMLAKLYCDAGADVHIVSMKRLNVAGPHALWRLWRASRELRSLIESLHIDLVVANTSRAAYVAVVGLWGSTVPVIWWVRDFYFGRVVFRAFKHRVAKILCVSHAIRRFYGGDADERFEVVHVGASIHSELEALSREQVRAERARWGFSDRELVVGFMGRLVSDKGAEDVVEAVARVHARDRRVRLLFVGEGRGQTGDIEARLRELVAARQWSFAVFAGFQRAEALYYRLFDLFVLATRTPEPYATSVVQAMMAGTPVVATATGGTPELVRDRQTGMLVPPRAPERMAAAIEELLEDPSLRAHVSEQALREVMLHNREDLLARRVESIYAGLISRAAC